MVSSGKMRIGGCGGCCSCIGILLVLASLSISGTVDEASPENTFVQRENPCTIVDADCKVARQKGAELQYCNWKCASFHFTLSVDGEKYKSQENVADQGIDMRYCVDPQAIYEPGITVGNQVPCWSTQVGVELDNDQRQLYKCGNAPCHKIKSPAKVGEEALGFGLILLIFGIIMASIGVCCFIAACIRSRFT